MVADPIVMKKAAEKSYFQVKTSSRHLVERIIVVMIAVVALQAISVKSMKGSMKTCKTAAMTARNIPKANFPEQYVSLILLSSSSSTYDSPPT